MRETFEFELELLDWPEGAYDALNKALKDEDVDVVESKAFTGEGALKVLGAYSKKVAQKLAELFHHYKKLNQKIVIKVGESEVRLEGFGGEDLKTMTNEIENLLQVMKVEN